MGCSIFQGCTDSMVFCTPYIGRGDPGQSCLSALFDRSSCRQWVRDIRRNDNSKPFGLRLGIIDEFGCLLACMGFEHSRRHSSFCDACWESLYTRRVLEYRPTFQDSYILRDQYTYPSHITISTMIHLEICARLNTNGVSGMSSTIKVKRMAETFDSRLLKDKKVNNLLSY